MDSGELKRRFGKHVHGLREAKGLTQEQLADRIGRNVDTVGNIERGVNATRIEVAYQIAIELGVRFPDLFAFESEIEPTEPITNATGLALIELIDGRDEETTARLLDLVRVGLRLAEVRSKDGGQRSR
ncbi:helix-turn-helix transcriptional regulator [Methylobacterium trifolii]|uniref:HTH cro/C1-type domain-containing protein n=1 Tax=Methylobacterium trifolii TaxID=1003092 RepID=A0ABQ4U0Q4_9HYPH|nr:helix-turn-helix domain-containing protein [Methylobacterium trifolii]GJE60462.1 hypothetical protein MPOCJGCO_2574 [Methylobacterium trifolii]